MFRVLYYSLKIDTYYAINSFIYYLRKLPILKKIIDGDSYKANILKYIGAIVGIILSLGNMFLNKFIYFLIIYLLANFINKSTFTFFHIYFFFSIIGMFIHNQFLSTGIKKYLSIMIFKMDTKKYLKYNLFWIFLTNFIFNLICFIIFKMPLSYSLMLVVYQLGLRMIGEGFNIWYFRKYNNFWYNNTILYFSILGILLLFAISPYFGIMIDKDIIFIGLIISIIGGIIGYIYFDHFDDYKPIMKILYASNNKMNESNNRLEIVAVKDRDIEINNRLIENKSGYDYFNTIFFERHKNILLRSSRNYSIILFIIYSVSIYFLLTNKQFFDLISYTLEYKMGIFVFIMYFINRGSIVTQAMFYNCDHAMLKYNFYREPKVIVGLFKKRLITIIKVNMISSLVIGIGNVILLLLVGNMNILNTLSTFLFIIILSVFFSIHYLVMYYLIQPYDNNMRIKKISYSVISLITYFLSYEMFFIEISSVTFSIIGLLFCILYIFISIKLIENFAPRTFKLN